MKQKRRKRYEHDPRWDFENRVEWEVYLGVQGIKLTVLVMAPPDATDMELLTAAASKLAKQRKVEEVLEYVR